MATSEMQIHKCVSIPAAFWGSLFEETKVSSERLLSEILRGESRGVKEVLDSENPSDWGSGFILKGRFFLC